VSKFCDTLCTCSTALALLDDGEEDDGVRDDDDEEREQVDHDDAEDGVGSGPRLAGEGVEGDALRVPVEVRVYLDVENVDLEKIDKRIKLFSRS
jgi:hypothetical protein